MGIVGALAVVLTGLPVVTGVWAVPADAIMAGQAGCPLESYYDSEGNLEYREVCPPGQEDGNEGDSGGLPCEFNGNYDEFCDGEAACWGNNPAAVENPTELEGVPPPAPDAHVAYMSCRNPDGSTYDEWYWSMGSEPPVEVQAQEAYGNLQTPAFTLAFNPPQRTYVSLETWWWVEGPSTSEIEGSSTFTVVAIGTPDRIEVDPGDGSGIITCEWTTSESSECVHVYQRASVNGTAQAADGSPAYGARARLVYSVRFERNGEVLDLAGLPAELTSPWESTAVPVAEIQSLITNG